MAAARVQTIRHQLARHYLQALQAASSAFHSGYEHSAYGLALFDREWPQIKHWQDWSAAHRADDREAARLCAGFPPAGAELLALRQTPPERVAWLTAGRQAARALGDQRNEAACLCLLAWALHKQAATEAADAAGQAALALAEAVGDLTLMGRSLHVLGEIAVRRGEFAAAQQLHTRSLERLRAAGDQAHLAEVYFSLSELTYLQGNFASARDYAEQSHALLAALGLSPTTNNNLTWLGVTTRETGDLAGGEQYVQQSLALCRATGAQSTLAHGLYVLSNFRLLQQRYAEAQAALAESVQIAEAIGEAWLIPYLLLQRADLAGRLGEPRAALDDIELAVATARATGYRLTLSTALIHRTKALLALGETGPAGEALREGLEIATATQMMIDLIHGLLVAAQLWRQNGAGRQAAEWTGLLLSQPGVESQMRADAQTLAAALAAELGPSEWAAAVEQGRQLSLEQVIVQIIQALPEPDLIRQRTHL